MLDNHKLLAAAIVISIAGVMGLYFYAASIGPVEIAINDIGEEDVGSLVTVEGMIRSVDIRPEGSATYDVGDSADNSTLLVYVQPDAHVNWMNDEPGAAVPGTVCSFTGVLEKYQERFELVVSKAGDIKVLKGAGEVKIEPWQLLSSPEFYDGMTVWTSGTIEEPYLLSDSNGTKGMGFELESIHENMTYRLSCVVFDKDMIGDYVQGSPAEVSGTFQYYSGTGSWQVMIDDETDILTLP